MNFPLSLDTPIYHFRFKTEINEKDGSKKYKKILKNNRMAWIDISNLNAKVPFINGCVYVKILKMKSEG